MSTFFFIVILIIVFIGIPIGAGWFIHWAIKSSGHPKAAKSITLIYGLIVLISGVFIYFEDEFFTKEDARFFVEEQGIELMDEFKVVHNESSSAIGDYYHTFTIEISGSDKRKAINEIKKSENFQSEKSSVDTLLYLSGNRYFGPKVTQNYETENAFIREFFEPSGQKGYAPTFRKIEISKSRNELTFKEINE
ncbi:hypothetical protein E7Z59_07145 [Robertkochia marina]|uniref:Uncharacterized protein n=1 Tax=Robertkochia marina TaxID=1227945 RepID=A0A4S3LZB8_9FLAO|nr:hypothetical protein [Robertkochia marina]THD67431.1 hypothetical protein E7Z59_07145 [Robertkochia marina]TRZ40774.1 hypothetical protein D3A96_15400 [Robertkochia marina]